MNLPIFRYHPDPVATGAFVPTNDTCDCCQEARGYKYNSTMYARSSPDCICPWCIGDGRAALKFDGIFLDSDPLIRAGVSQAVVDEVCLRTPGYNSWQQQVWQAHCADACEFHGDASEAEVLGMNGEALAVFLTRSDLKAEHLPRLQENYVPGGDASVFKFVCRKCRLTVYNLDLS